MLNVTGIIGFRGNMRRKRTVEIGDILHVYNRGVDKRRVYSDTRDYCRFIDYLSYCRKYNYPFSTHQKQLKQATTEESRKVINSIQETFHAYKTPLCKIIAYMLMPNHFHLILEETHEGGIARFMQKVSNAYTKYFNRRNERSGSLFQGRYKYVWIESNEQLLHLSRYIHINPVTTDIVSVNKITDYPWSSLRVFLNSDKKTHIVDGSIIFEQFKYQQEYLDFITAEYRTDQEAYTLENLTIDDDFGWY